MGTGINEKTIGRIYQIHSLGGLVEIFNGLNSDVVTICSNGVVVVIEGENALLQLQKSIAQICLARYGSKLKV